MADAKSKVRKDGAHAEVSKQDVLSTERAAVEAEQRAKRAKQALKQAKKESKQASKAARKARKAKKAAHKAFKKTAARAKKARAGEKRDRVDANKAAPATAGATKKATNNNTSRESDREGRTAESRRCSYERFRAESVLEECCAQDGAQESQARAADPECSCTRTDGDGARYVCARSRGPARDSLRLPSDIIGASGRREERDVSDTVVHAWEGL